MDSLCKHILGIIDSERKFPQRVFYAGLGGFLFFDADYVFAPDFVGILRRLLRADQSHHAAILNLDEFADPTQQAASCIAVSDTITEQQYMLTLRGSGPPSGWLYRMDRFAIASKTAAWCVYCERANEIAVVGFRNPIERELINAFSATGALSIGEALEKPLSYGFSNQAISQRWREMLIHEYTS